jgi:hypothetical protein
MKSILRILGIDRSVAYTLLGRSWSIAAGLANIWFIAHFLSNTEQGFYYTFANLIGLQIVFELGLGYVISQFVSHEMARLSWAPTGTLQGDPVTIGRIRSLLVLTLKWYGVAACSIIFAVFPIGCIFFSRSANSFDVIWQPAWFLLTIAAAINIFITPIFSLLEGCNLVADVARMRTAQAVAGSLACWSVLLGQGKLLAMPAMMGTAALIGLLWLIHRHKKFFLALLSARSSEGKICWRSEIWPFQWRIAVSWLSGYFIFQLFVPVLFAYKGATEAGQMGMSLSIANSIASVAIAWINTKTPLFGNLIALKRFNDLDTLYFRAFWQSTCVVLMGVASLMLARIGLSHFDNPYSVRLLPILPFAFLLLTVTINHISFAQAVYLRSHKEEPFAFLSVFIAILVAGSTLILGKLFGASGMMAGYFLCSCVGLAWGSRIFWLKRVEWISNH